jgi:hypothetical protein
MATAEQRGLGANGCCQLGRRRRQRGRGLSATLGWLLLGAAAAQPPPPPPPALAFCCNVSASASTRCGAFPHPGKLCFDELCDKAKDVATCQKTNSTCVPRRSAQLRTAAHPADEAHSTDPAARTQVQSVSRASRSSLRPAASRSVAPAPTHCRGASRYARRRRRPPRRCRRARRSRTTTTQPRATARRSRRRSAAAVRRRGSTGSSACATRPTPRTRPRTPCSRGHPDPSAAPTRSDCSRSMPTRQRSTCSISRAISGATRATWPWHACAERVPSARTRRDARTVLAPTPTR